MAAKKGAAASPKTVGDSKRSTPVKKGHSDEGTLMGVPLVGIIMGSDSDLPVMSEAAKILDTMGVPYELTVVSAHRTPLRMVDYARTARDRGIRVIVAGAGGAAHLPGMVASLTPLPVVGVPVQSRSLQGLDSLLSIVQMPMGIPVATVAINQAANAGLLAVRILAISDQELAARMIQWQKDLEIQVLAKADRIEAEGWKPHLAAMQEVRQCP